MKYDFVFNHVKKSEGVRDYAGDKLDKLQKFELKPFAIQFIFSEEKKQKYAELVINGKDKRWVAKGYGQNLYQAIDQCIHRMSKQLRKNKDKLQKHKKPHLSHEHALECMNEQLEWDYSKITGTTGQKVA